MTKQLNIKVDSFLPVFPGFYGTCFEPDEESSIEDGKTYDSYEWDYVEYRNRVSEIAVDKVEEKLIELGVKCSIEFQSVYSPREYNFTNDSINVAIELKNLRSVISILHENKDSFCEYIEANYKSRSGFVSFYEYDFNTWIYEYLNPENEKFSHCIGAVLDFILSTDDYDNFELYSEVADTGQMYVDGVLINTTNN